MTEGLSSFFLYFLLIKKVYFIISQKIQLMVRLFDPERKILKKKSREKSELIYYDKYKLLWTDSIDFVYYYFSLKSSPDF